MQGRRGITRKIRGLSALRWTIALALAAPYASLGGAEARLHAVSPGFASTPSALGALDIDSLWVLALILAPLAIGVVVLGALLYRSAARARQSALENQRLAEALAEREERFQLAIEGASVGIWDWPDVRRQEAWWSPKLYALLGYEYEEIPATVDSFNQLIHPEDLPATRRVVEACLGGQQNLSVDLRMRTKDGVYRWYMGTATLQRDADGKPRRLAGSLQDIHERRQAEEARAYAFVLERSNRDLAEFTYAASHDLQEPLRTITNFLELLESRYAAELPDQARQFIAFTTDAAHRMRQLIRGLLNLSRVDSHNVPAQQVELDTVLEEAKRDLGQLMQERGGLIRSATPLPTVIGYPNLLGQLFQNLLSNALKYCPPERSPEIDIDWQEDDESVTLRFSDNGIGIAPEFRETIFGVFKRLHTRSAYEGSGIGLSLCRKIVERHHGRVWVESEGEQGSRFHVRLSKRLRPAPASADP